MKRLSKIIIMVFLGILLLVPAAFARRYKVKGYGFKRRGGPDRATVIRTFKAASKAYARREMRKYLRRQYRRRTFRIYRTSRVRGGVRKRYKVYAYVYLKKGSILLRKIRVTRIVRARSKSAARIKYRLYMKRDRKCRTVFITSIRRTDISITTFRRRYRVKGYGYRRGFRRGKIQAIKYFRTHSTTRAKYLYRRYMKRVRKCRSVYITSVSRVR